jgi:hypothetical protein
VAHNTQNYGLPCAADAVYVYEHDASGNETPLRVLTGSATQLDEPNGIYVGKWGESTFIDLNGSRALGLRQVSVGLVVAIGVVDEQCPE